MPSCDVVAQHMTHFRQRPVCRGSRPWRFQPSIDRKVVRELSLVPVASRPQVGHRVLFLTPRQPGKPSGAPVAAVDVSQGADPRRDRLPAAEKASVILLFSDAVLATAILDRLLHHSTTINIKGESYRAPASTVLQKPPQLALIHEARQTNAQAQDYDRNRAELRFVRQF